MRDSAGNSRRRAGLALALFVLYLVSGCAYLQQDLGAPLLLDRMDRFESGRHYSEVLGELGPPSEMSALPNGMVFQYQYVRVKERQYGLRLPGKIGEWFKAVYAAAKANVEVMQFVFDEQGVLQAADAEAWKADAGAGFSVTLIFSAGSLTDTTRYEESGSHTVNWGASLTFPLLESLNVAQSLESGTRGVQLIATPTIVGQHTLGLQAAKLGLQNK